MTISSTVRVVEYLLNGVTLVFTLPFRVDETVWVTATRQTGTATPVVLVNGADFTVSHLGEDAALFTLTAAGTADDVLQVVRTVPITQPTRLRNRGAYIGEDVEQSIDRLTMIAHQLVGGGLLPVGIDPNLYAWPEPEADKVIGWNSTATQLINISMSAIVTGGGGGGGGGGSPFDITTYSPLGVTPDNADRFVIYDESAAAHKSVTANLAVGTLLGDARIKLATDQLSVLAETTVAFGSVQHNTLQLGTFSSVTSTYTCTATLGCRVDVDSHICIGSQTAGGSGYVSIQKNGVDIDKFEDKVEADSTSRNLHLRASAVISLALGDVVRVRAQSSVSKSLLTTAGFSTLNIRELA